MKHWNPYTPIDAVPWNRARVVHLHRRAVFGATAAEQQRDLDEDPQAAVTRILTGTVRINTPASFDDLSDVIGSAAADSPNPDRLKAWWLYRCLFTSDPLQERLTLKWHNHFATSNLKVNNLHQMMQQNESLRKHSRSPFGVLLRAMLQDPALLVWLDAPANRKGQPNENLARELMELFTLGVGNYTETDVKESARALTGWTVRSGRFEERAAVHDDGEKTIAAAIRTVEWGRGRRHSSEATGHYQANRVAADVRILRRERRQQGCNERTRHTTAIHRTGHRRSRRNHSQVVAVLQ